MVEFLLREDNSYTLPSRKDQAKGQQRYALADTLCNLYKKFCLERPAGQGVSLSTFSKARPEYVRASRYIKREVCLCKIHANAALMCEAIAKLPKSVSQLVQMQPEDVEKKIVDHPKPTVSYMSWERVDKDHKGRAVSHTKLVKKSVDKQVFKEDMMSTLPSIKAHCDRVSTQYEQLQHLEKVLPSDHVIVQMDYSLILKTVGLIYSLNIPNPLP